MRSNRQRYARTSESDQRERPEPPRPRHAGPPGELAPERAAERDAGGDRRQVQRQPARPHPRGQHLLRGDVERGEAEQPADPGHDAEHHRRDPVRQHGEQEQAEGDQRGAEGEHPVRAEALAHAGHDRGRRHGAEADARVQDAEPSRSPPEVLAGVDRHQRHQAGAGHAEHERAHQHAVEDAREHRVAQAGADGPGEALGRSDLLLDGPLPAPQHVRGRRRTTPR